MQVHHTAALSLAGPFLCCCVGGGAFRCALCCLRLSSSVCVAVLMLRTVKLVTKSTLCELLLVSVQPQDREQPDQHRRTRARQEQKQQPAK